MPAHRARGVGPVVRLISGMRARTIRVVFAAKLRKNLVLHAHSLLVDLASKLSPVPVPAQCRLVLTRLRVPHLDRLVIASTCHPIPIWAPCDGADPAVFDEMIQHTKELRQGKKIRWKKKISPI